MSSCPNSATAFSTRASQTPSCLRSPAKTAVSPSISAAASRGEVDVEVVHEHARSVRAQQLRRRPPIPRADPVTIAALPSSTLISLVASFAYAGGRFPAESRIAAMSARTGRPLAQGDVLWEPPADARERFELGRYLEWLRTERGLDFPGYDEAWHWSISDLEAFWASIWDFYEVRSHAPVRAGARLARDARRGVVPGVAVELRRAHAWPG